ncbi:leucyl aminopeptidase [Roseiarcaceae bacterium H3SJ34-1]|uniref:leucyl aminopeptidase n=1 Tax=Terripilifer ovatus TaxID=3032367 RepID=UPI003AB9857E|nr:leucyl aminopeptidase [Roseiarcaceae bacterium H3SJ34-1]
MPRTVTIEFIALSDVTSSKAAARAKPVRGGPVTLVVFAGQDLKFSGLTATALGAAEEVVKRAAKTAGFTGARLSCLDVLAPAGIAADRLLVIGTAAKKDAKSDAPAQPLDYAALGGYVMGKLGKGTVHVCFDLPEAADADAAADFLLGMRLRAYRFEIYKTKKADDEANKDPKNDTLSVRIAVIQVAEARREAIAREAIAAGVVIARDLVNEPANVLYPEEFAKRAQQLKKLGVEVDVLDVKAMKKLGMNTLLGVGQGSSRDSRLVVMRWNGAKNSKAKPVSFIGKGVTFDTGGISIKPAAGMEDMKGDMAGAACVVGLIHALAARKAKVNAIGAIGIVENMPDGNAQRPGDIVTTMSGQTVEVINTDAEGRLVLADVLWYIQDKYKPQFMINLATLTGAILVSLGNEHAGLFSNNDELSTRVTAAGTQTGEKVWRMPLGPAYDKMLDSKFADMKNIGGRLAGSITAAQFLQRFVNKTPWVHLDIAGTGMASPSSEINQSWGSGWGVRLLDRLVANHYES